MKNLFISIIAILMPMLAMGQTLLYENDFTSNTSFENWYQFDESQTDGTVELTSEGLAITVGIQTGELWQPQVMVVPDGSFNLKQGNKYTVVVTAKFPCAGTLQINMGTWTSNDQAQFPVSAAGDFQEVVCEFSNWSVNAEGAHLLFMCGDFKGTILLKKIEIWNGDAPHKGKWTVAGDQELLDVDWNVTSNSNRMLTYDDENFTLTKTGFMLPKGTYEFKVFNTTETQESYPNTNVTLVIEEDAVYTVVFTFNANTKEVAATATKTDGFFYNYIENGKIAEVILNPNKYKGEIVIPEKVTHDGVEYTVTKIADNAFSYCDGLKSVTIPSSVTSIGSYAFQYCTGLSSITIPGSVTSIGIGLFSHCTALKYVTLLNNITSIDTATFDGCTQLMYFMIPNYY